MKIQPKSNKGFSLIELVIVIAIIAILVALLVPNYLGYIKKSKYSVDMQTLQQLNTSTQVFESSDPATNPFIDESYGDSSLMLVLINEGYFPKAPVAKEEDASFIWDFDGHEWLISFSSILDPDKVTFITAGGQKGYLKGYSGTAAKITIPGSLNGVAITHIYQDAFSNKGLTTVTFSNDSNTTRIHARAFQNNNLTTLALPDSLERIDYGAFLGNNITKITIGTNVYFEGKVINGSDAFKTAYESQGAGTYLYVNGAWIKQ